MTVLFYYNFRTRSYEERDMPPDDWSPYIPQIPAAQNLYRILVENMHKTPAEAAKHVLEILVEKE